MFKHKNSFYRKLKLHPDIRGAIRFYNEIKKKMLMDLDSQGYYRKRKERK